MDENENVNERLLKSPLSAKIRILGLNQLEAASELRYYVIYKIIS